MEKLGKNALAAIGIDLDAVRARIESSFGPEALAQVVHREPRLSGLKGGASALVLLQRAHPDIFEDALCAVINKSGHRNPRTSTAVARSAIPALQHRAGQDHHQGGSTS
jgi:hypothetical protein